MPESSLFIFSRWRIITISGIAIEAITKGQRDAKCQLCLSEIAKNKNIGNATEAMIDVSM